MPDLTDRLTHEGELSTLLGKAFRKQRGRVAAAGIDGQADWSSFQFEIGDAFVKHLAGTFSIASENMVRTQVDNNDEETAFLLLLLGGKGLIGTLPKRSADWADGVATLLASQVTTTTRGVLNRARLADSTSSGIWKSAIEMEFKLGRAASISATETTRAVSQGEAFGRQTIEEDLNQVALKIEPFDPELAALLLLLISGGALSKKTLTAVWITEVAAFGTNPPDPHGVCPICLPLHEVPERDWPAQHSQGPPAHPNCLLPGTIVSARGVIAAMRFRYVGAAVVITSAKGRKLAVTANHKVLTTRGFVAAQDLQAGDDLIGTTGEVGSPSPVHPDDYEGPARIEDVFSAFSESAGMSSCRVPVSAKQFNGDGEFGEGHVDVVTSESPFWLTFNTFSGKMFDQLPVCTDWNGSKLASLCDLDSMLVSLSLAAHSVVCRGRDPLYFLSGTLPQSYDIGRAASARGEIGYAESVVDSPPGNSESIGCLLDRFSSLVAVDQVVNVDVKLHHGTVYDLQTESGLYAASSLLASNCRCYLDYRKA